MKKDSTKLFGIALILLFLGFFIGVSVTQNDNERKEILSKGFTTNEYFINALYAEIDTEDHMEVFRFVFSQLEEEVTIYPTENFYYYKFIANGKTYGGAMGLSTRDRDSGVFHFGYIARPEFGRTDVMKKSDDGGGDALTEEDGVIVEKVDDFTYTVTFEDKTVTFNMFQPGVNPPKKAKLREDEIYIGPVMDESGLQFHLLFNEDSPQIYHVLNEDVFVAEEFDNYANDILIGERTSFAFYDDNKNNRKIVIGVDAKHVLNNDWYDGPFDHMPDNYIATGEVEFQKYVEAAYPGTAGRINEHARYIERNGTRVAIAPYMVYYDKEDVVKVVEECRDNYLESSPDFYRCITKQVFEGPKPKYNLR